MGPRPLQGPRPLRPLRLAFRDGFLAGLPYWGIGWGWVFQSQAGSDPALPIAFLLAIPLLASTVGGFALAIAWIARRSPRLALAAAPGIWATIEYARSQEWVIAVPWNHLGYAIGDWPTLAQGASVFGLYGLSAWIVAVNAGLVLLPRLAPAARALVVAALSLPLLPGLMLPAPAEGEASLRVAAVQPFVGEDERHVPMHLGRNLRHLLDLTAPAAVGADLVVWPESAWERAVGGAGDAFLAVIAHDLGTPVLTGAWRLPPPGEEHWRNAAVLATRDGRTAVVSEKAHPVPMYERAPESALGRWLAGAGFWPGRFGRGRPPEPVSLETERGGTIPIAALVCIDSSHPELARSVRRAGARLLVSIANEASTGAWSAALHARAARLRAIENRVPVVRVANTGPTLWIDEHGRVAAGLALRILINFITLVIEDYTMVKQQMILPKEKD
jgi:apolipoprotein N-acyltransferase